MFDVLIGSFTSIRARAVVESSSIEHSVIPVNCHILKEVLRQSKGSRTSRQVRLPISDEAKIEL